MSYAFVGGEVFGATASTLARGGVGVGVGVAIPGSPTLTPTLTPVRASATT